MRQNNIVEARDRFWSVQPEGEKGEYLIPENVDPNTRVNPRVTLDLEDPRVGKTAKWGGGHWSLVHAVIYVDGQPTQLLLKDWTGWPWVRTNLDAELRD